MAMFVTMLVTLLVTLRKNVSAVVVKQSVICRQRLWWHGIMPLYSSWQHLQWR